MNIFKKINKNLIGYVIGVGLLLFFFIFFIISTQIGYGVKERCQTAQSQYGGECVDALMEQLADTSTEYNKNDAIWALGQLGDEKALPLLEKYIADQTTSSTEYGIWNKGISQYELRKATKLIKSNFNISSFVWR